jgi:UDP-glucose 4-epimerase
VNPFHQASLLITGGTGSFGHAVLRHVLQHGPREIRILSRDEKKQDDMRKRYGNALLKFYIGDVRDYQSVLNAVRGVDYIFHAAALKQVPSCEFYPMEAVKTNVHGTENVLEAAVNCAVKRVVCLSTDKAVYPINAMGISKALMEKVATAKARTTSTVITVTRYGNVMGSRGSVIPLFMKQMRLGVPVTITDPAMTRFMMSLDDAVRLVLYAFEHGEPGDILVQKSPAATIKVLHEALAQIMGISAGIHEIIGTRHGEKLFEVLMSREEMSMADDCGKYFRIRPDRRDLNYGKYMEQGTATITAATEYNSHNTERLTVEQMKVLLGQTQMISKFARGEYMDAED